MSHEQRSVSGKPEPTASGLSRRTFLTTAGAAGVFSAVGPQGLLGAGGEATTDQSHGEMPDVEGAIPVTLRINGKDHELRIDPRTTLLDCLREVLALTGTKKGCDHGQCGACTVHVNGRRVLSCLTLALLLDGQEITTIEGLGAPDELH